MNVIKPIWPASAAIHALVTTRQGGISSSPYADLNLGDHVGDESSRVIANRQVLRKYLPTEPFWLKQTHSIQVSTPESRSQSSSKPFEADAAVTNVPDEVLAILTADCLPVLLSNADGTLIGAAHAGWRGLCDGVLENTVGEMRKLVHQSSAKDLIAWMGPAIGPESFEVGEDVVGRFQECGLHQMNHCFLPIPNKPGKYLADLYQLARDRLKGAGVASIYGGDLCTVQDQERFFSYRRDGVTGRFASLIWISPQP
jgi:YfiH family protein